MPTSKTQPSKEMKKTILFLAVCITSSFSPTKEESKLIDELNIKYPEYEFAPFGADLEDVHIKLTIKKETPDTLTLENLYKQFMVMNKDSLGKSKTPWLYIVVYGRNGGYLFTMRDYDNEITFFRDGFF